MKTKPFYLLKGTLYRNKEKDMEDLIEINEEFCDDKPIKARKKAFSIFQSYIEVLLQSKQKEYETHQQAHRDIQPFIDSNQRKFFLNIPELEMDKDFDKGLYLYFIPNPDQKMLTKEKEAYYPEKYIIHYIDNNNIDLCRYLQKSLVFEFNYYKNHNFDIDHKESRTYKKDSSGKIMKFSILETPLSDVFKIL